MISERGLAARAKAWALVGLAAASAWAGPIDNGGLVTDGAELGAAVAYAGDFNQDGLPDLVVGAPKQSSTYPDEGVVLLYPGVVGGLGMPQKLGGGASYGAHLGASVAGNCDLNGDGAADVVAGAPGAASGKGQVFVFLGGRTTRPSSTPLTGPVAGGGFGATVACPGDVDGDGRADLAVGAPQEASATAASAGAVYLFRGNGDGSFSTQHTVVRGAWAGAQLGSALVAVGDVTGDNRRDLVAGAPSAAEALYGGQVVLLGVRTSGALEALKNWWSPARGFAATAAALGDVNGDGLADVAVSVAGPGGSEPVQESVQVFSVSSDGFVAVGPALAAPANANDFGLSLAGPGDLNGDGYADLLVGVGAAPHPTGVATSSVVAVYLGSADGLRAAPLLLWPTVLGTSSGFGAALSGTGDVTGDGFADFVVGEPRGLASTVGSGAVSLFPGGARGPADGSPIVSTPRIPRAVALLGDVDGDGLGDYAVGLPGGGNVMDSVFVEFPQRGGGPTRRVTLTGVEPRARFGASVAAAGDVNGDGFADLLVGGPDYGLDATGGGDPIGSAYLYRGKPDGIEDAPTWIFIGDADTGKLGASLAGVGDVNGDGFDDVVVGVPGAFSNKGQALVFHGAPTGLTDVPATVLAAPLGGMFGASVAGVGDIDLDGFADLVVAAPGVSNGSINGRAYVYFGGPDGVGATPGWVLGGQQSFEHGLGRAVSGLGDVDGDRFPDLVAVATPPNEAGRVRALIYPGGMNRALPGAPRVVELPQVAAQVPVSVDVAGVGDVDGDGLGDFVLSCGDLGNGLAVLYAGQRGAMPRLHPWAPGNASTPMRFGSALAGGFDVDGDGFNDFIVGSQDGLQSYAGGDLRIGRPIKLAQSFSGALRGRGYRAGPGEAVVLQGEVADEVAGLAPLRLEVEVKPVHIPFDGMSTELSAPALGGVASVALDGGLEGRFHWRARVISGGLAGHWRAYGGENETFTDFSVGLPQVMEPDGGAVGRDAGTADGGATSDGPMVFDTAGCNCSALPIGPTALALLALLARRLRRRAGGGYSDSL